MSYPAWVEVLVNTNFHGLFNTQAILVEEQQWYYLTHCWENKEVHTFSRDICSKVDITLQLEFELFYLFEFLRWSVMIFIIKCFHTIVFIFIVIFTTFWPIYPLAFFRCLSNLGTYSVLYWIHGGLLFWFH